MPSPKDPKKYKEWKEKMKGRKAWNKGLSSKNDKRILAGSQHPMFGKQHTKSAKLRVSKANKGKLIGDKNPSKRLDHEH